MSWVKSFEGLLDFLSLVIVHAPDEFPKEDYLSDDEQLTLELAFEELNHGMQFVKQRITDGNVVMQLQSTLDASLAAYREGNDVKGAHLLQGFEKSLLENNP
jgi:exonuclease VII small subunit